MGSIYVRGGTLWLAFRDPGGKRRNRSGGFKVGEEKQAQLLLERIEGAPAPVVVEGLTVAAFTEGWVAKRKLRKVGSADAEEQRLRDHALPVIGQLMLAGLKPRHLRDLMLTLPSKKSRKGGELAPRTIRHVYSTLHRMFRDAVADELMPSNPCVLAPDELPAKADKDPAWRATAVYTHGEVESLISDARIPEDRRVLYAVIFLAGLRFGEASALTWRDLEDREPLARLLVTRAWSASRKSVGPLKTARKGIVFREVPVHPTLAKVLAAWRIGGWARMLKRIPLPDDLIIPSRLGGHRGPNHGLKKLHADLARLGLRVRRQHDARRTLISLAQADGATKETLRPSTHPRPIDQFDEYSSLPWEARCRAISQLRIELLEGKVLQLRAAAGAPGDVGKILPTVSQNLPTASFEEGKRHQEATVSATLSAEKGEGPDSGEESGPSGGGVYGTRSHVRPRPRPLGTDEPTTNQGVGPRLAPPLPDPTAPDREDCSTADSPEATGPGPVHPLFSRTGAPLRLDWRREVEAALDAWARSGDDLTLAEYLETVAAELRRGAR